MVIALCGLEAAVSADPAAPPLEVPAQSSRWVPELNLRLRSELETFAADANRHRLRVRVRAGAAYRLDHGIEVGMRLATGSADPTSGQLTLDGTFDKSPLRLDRAYFRYHPGPWLDLWGGKVPIEFENRRLVWDRDIQPEGLTEIVEQAVPRAGLSLRLALGQYLLGRYVLFERSDGTRDPAVLVAQLGVAGNRGPVGWALHGAHYRYLYVTRTVLDYDHGANTRTAEGLLVHDYHLLDLVAELSVRSGSVAPTAYAELVHNTAVAEAGSAIATGLDLELVPLAARIGYEYRRVGRDAILDNLAETSWYGPRRTDFQGHRVRLAWYATPELRLSTSAKLMDALRGPSNRQVEWLVDLKWTL